MQIKGDRPAFNKVRCRWGDGRPEDDMCDDEGAERGEGNLLSGPW